MRIFILFIYFILFVSYVSCASLEMREMDYECFSVKDNQPRWQAKAAISSADNIASIYKISEEAKGIYSGYDGEITRKTVVFYEKTTDDNYRILKSQTEFFTQDQKLILKELQTYDYANKKVYIEAEDYLKHKAKKGELEIRGQIANKLTLPLQIRKTLLANRKFEPIYFVSSKPALYKVDLRVIKEEELDFNNQKIKAYKILLDPDIGIFNILKFLVTNTFVWFNSDMPYELVKYEGLETDLGSERVIVCTNSAKFE
ncbi:MAG: hypothetical protein AB1755_02115 [Candidatus Omnitrophota bacterium]